MKLAEWLKYVEQVEKQQAAPAEVPETTQNAPTAPALEEAKPAAPAAAVAGPARPAPSPLKPSVEAPPPVPAQPVPEGVTAAPASATQQTAKDLAPPPVAAAPPPVPKAAAPEVPAAPTARESRKEDPTLRIPEIEDFLPFLRDPEPEPEARQQAPEPVKEVEPQVSSVQAPAGSNGSGATAARSVPEAPPAEAEESEPAAALDRLPRHIQTLAKLGGKEVAQHSYKRGFREQRGDLLQRLLDPPLSLEDAARILNVCPTTVRRYTNKGVLPHFRTVGNQRRFRLSDVIAFMESQGGRRKKTEPTNTSAEGAAD